MKVKTYGYIENEIKLIRRSEFIKSALRLKRKGQNRTRILITIERATKKRSLDQNAYYWGVVISSLIDAYYNVTSELITDKQAHDILKFKFCRKEIINPKTGKIEETLGSTKELTTLEFEQYQDKCRLWIMDFFGVSIPLPNEQGELFE